MKDNVLEDSLLYELTEIQIKQIFSDFSNPKKIEFHFCIDASDILEYIDPYSVIYQNYELDKSDGYLADENYAIKALVNSKKKIYFLPEYQIEFSTHKELMYQIFERNNKLLDFVKTIEVFDNDEVREFVEQNYSYILFVLSGHSKRISDLYYELFKNDRIQIVEHQKFYKDVFSMPLQYFSDDDKQKIDLLYELFKKTGEGGFSNLTDAVCFYKILKSNINPNNGIRYIYLSSAPKTKKVVDKIRRILSSDDTKIKQKWTWLEDILVKHPDEKLFFVRDRQYLFGFVVFKRLRKDLESDDNKPRDIKKYFSETCLLYNKSSDPEKDYREDKIVKIIFQKRQQLENVSVLKASKLPNSSNQYEKIEDKQKIDSLIEQIKKLKGQDLLEEIRCNLQDEILSIEVLNKLNKFCSVSEELIIDRGRDSIISLFNVIPPLFLNLDNSIKNKELLKNKQVIQDLILYASRDSSENKKINRERVLELINFNKYKNNYENNLIFIFILLFVKSEIGKTDSNTIAYNLSKEYIKHIENRIELSKLAKEKRSPEIVSQLQLILQEFYVLKIWAQRRMGDDYSTSFLAKIDILHKELRGNYNNDYRFIFSHFLFRIHLFYTLKKDHSFDIDFLIEYMFETFILGEKALENLMKNCSKTSEGSGIPNLYGSNSFSEENSFLNHILISVLNGISFVNSVYIDLTLMKNNGKLLSDIRSDHRISRAVSLIQILIKDRKKVSDKISNWGKTKISHPVYIYVESYGDFLNGVTSNDKNKIDQALLNIQKLINNLDQNNRPYLYDCCDKLRNIILEAKDLTKPYKSFIMSVNDRKTFYRNYK